MKKIIRAVSLLSAFACMATTFSIAACDDGENGGNNGGTTSLVDTDYEDLPAYKGDSYDGKTPSRVNFSTDLFYRNDFKAEGADPFVLDNTSRDGYYYLFQTNGYCAPYKSRDLINWDPLNHSLSTYLFDGSDESREEMQVTWEAIWAEEVIFDPDDGENGMYHMFLSAIPMGMDGSYVCMMLNAVSEKPEGPYKLVRYDDPARCGGQENVRPDNNPDYDDYWVKYCLFEPEAFHKYTEVLKINGGTSPSGYHTAIDPHPFVGPDGTKYLYFAGHTSIGVVQMKNWYTPIWSTAKNLTVSHYYTVEDFVEQQKTGTLKEEASYEMGDTSVNEGPCMTYHNGMYYLTFSINGYGATDYQLIQAVSERPDGPFRKLYEEEGGQLLNVVNFESKEISGPGHHSFVTLDGKEYIVYHRHNDPIAGGGPRNVAIDEVRWITIKDHKGDSLDVMYVNGPTWSVQPRLYDADGYNNIATEASVRLSQGKLAEGSKLSYLKDDLISLQRESDFVNKYVRETEISESSVFEFKFASPKDIRAVMVYNSSFFEKLFLNIPKIELDCIINGATATREIRDIKFPEEYYNYEELVDAIDYVDAGSAAFAEFDNITVNAVRVFVEVPEGQDTAAIPEIRILGKEGTATASVAEAYTPRFGYTPVERICDDGVVIDGSLDEQFWKEQDTVTIRKDLNPEGTAWSQVTSYCHFGENGVAFAFMVEGTTPVWVNPSRISWMNASVELYLWHEDAVADKDVISKAKGYEMDIGLDDVVNSKKRYYFRDKGGAETSWWGYTGSPKAISPYCASKVYQRNFETNELLPSKVNDENSNCFIVEYYVPWAYLEYTGFKGADETIESLRINPVVIVSNNYNGTDAEIDRKWFDILGASVFPVRQLLLVCTDEGVKRPS